MSTISGLFSLDGRPVHHLDSSRMTAALGRRGSFAHWHTDSIALARGEAPSNAAARTPPAVDAFGSWAIVADARIDNRKELRAALGIDDGAMPDSRLVLHAYARWGTECPAHLIGDFAFVIWDEQLKQLFCVRDRLGIKPLYYAHSAIGFAVASESKALLALPWVSRSVNTTRVADYLLHMNEDPEATFYERIKRLKPGHTLLVSADGRTTMSRYWTPDPHREIRYTSDEHYEEAYLELFREAVRCRVDGEGKTAAMLSGGFDSSSVACIAQPIMSTGSGDRLPTFSLVFADMPQVDERPFIEAVLQKGGFEPHYVFGDELSPLARVDEMLDAVDEPFITPSLFLYWELYRRAQGAGVSTILDGLMGDSVVGHGTRYFTELAASGRWHTLLQEFRATAAVFGVGRRSTYRYLMRDFVVGPLLVQPVLRALSTVRRPALPDPARSRFVNRDFLRGIDWMTHARHYGYDVPQTYISARKEQCADLQGGGFSAAFEIIDKAAGTFGLNVRFPFTDARLVEYCLAVPSSQKCRGGWTRRYARRAMANDMPEAPRTRHDKRYVGAALRRILFRTGRNEVEELAAERLSIAAPYVDVEAIRSVCRDGLADHTRCPPTAVPTVIAALVLTRWLEREQETAKSAATAFANGR